MIFYSRAAPRLPLQVTSNGSLSTIDYSGIRNIADLELRARVLRVISSSIQTIWTVWTPCLGLALLLAFVVPVMSLQSDTLKNGNSKASMSQSTTQNVENEKEAEV
ncbi:hypothetical protein AN958_01163 [Leucoagaricus sp. SymC.cos]|nr:hypothetical protein AN958_01163 [Leucoagaricus sp. SymC.cos]